MIEELIMGVLKDRKTYIAGGIDIVKDDGVGWRQSLKGKCKKADVLLHFLDPCDKPKELGQEIGEEKQRMIRLKEGGEKNWNQLQKEVKKFKRVDYRMVDSCDLFIIYIDINIHLCGSYFECKVAEEQRKPIFVILSPNMEKKDIPTWLVDLVKWDEIFLSVNNCVCYLQNIDNGNIELDDRWIKIF